LVRFAGVVGNAVRSAVEDRGRAALALSRGGRAFQALAEQHVAWSKVDVFQVDERAAPSGSEDRNLTAIERDLVERIAGPPPRIHAMPVDDDLDLGARTYAAGLEATCGRPPVLDVVHLGLGVDGHTASLLPGDDALEAAEPVAITGTYEGHRRMTLTLPVIGRARLVVFLVTGESKAGVLRRVVEGNGDLPARRVNGDDVVFLADSSAAAQLKSAL
jgi:6-phosphogluconolactonase